MEIPRDASDDPYKEFRKGFANFEFISLYVNGSESDIFLASAQIHDKYLSKGKLTELELKERFEIWRDNYPLTYNLMENPLLSKRECKAQLLGDFIAFEMQYPEVLIERTYVDNPESNDRDISELF